LHDQRKGDDEGVALHADAYRNTDAVAAWKSARQKRAGTQPLTLRAQ
jgi:hypothetical protein